MTLATPTAQRNVRRWINPTSALTAISVASAVTLGMLKVADAPALPQAVLQTVLVVAFAALVLVDIRPAVAIVLVEVACLGAGGVWTVFPGGLSGRQVLHAIVFARGLAILVAQWRRSGKLDLGRYGVHALVLAIALPLVWMPLGLLNGNSPRDVVGDGNAHLFFAFALVFVALISIGLGEWLRRWLFVACAVNAVVTGVLIAMSATGLVALYQELRPILLEDLMMGGAVGYMPNGAYRLYLGSGLYLQIGLALTVWHLLQRPRNPWLWALYALLLFDVTATYTRGFWFGSVLAVGTVLLIGARQIGRPLVVVGATAVIFALATGVGAIFDFSVPEYVFGRSASALSIGDSETGFVATPGPAGHQSPEEAPNYDPEVGTEDVAGAFSNSVRLEQARVLLEHIGERPLFGHGFGSIARDYEYGKIYSYELTYLDLAFKTGLLGLALFLSFPLRLMLDAARVRFRVLYPPRAASGITPRELAVVIAIIGSVLATSATNPYLLAAFGLMPILATIPWLQPADD